MQERQAGLRSRRVVRRTELSPPATRHLDRAGTKKFRAWMFLGVDDSEASKIEGVADAGTLDCPGARVS